MLRSIEEELKIKIRWLHMFFIGMMVRERMLVIMVIIELIGIKREVFGICTYVKRLPKSLPKNLLEEPQGKHSEEPTEEPSEEPTEEPLEELTEEPT
jgi:hypothetical protein